MTIEKSIKEEFLEECHNAFDFLITEYGFSQPEISESDHHTIKVIYYKKDIAIQCSLDIRDEMSSLRILRLENGKKPSAYRVNEKGEIIAEDFIRLLIHKGIRDLGIKNRPDVSGLTKRQANFRKELFPYKRLLKLYGQDILNGSAKIFVGYNEPGDNF